MAIVIIAVLSLFILFFIVVTVINSMRIVKSNQQLLTNKGVVDAIITKTVVDEKNITILVEFKSPTSLINFNKRFVLSKKNNKAEDFAEGKHIALQYPKLAENQKALNFPLLFGTEKPQFNLNFLMGSIALIIASIILLVVAINFLVRNNAFNKSVEEVIALFDFTTLLLISFGYVIAVQTMVTLLTTPNRDSLYDYLKVYGIKATARVKTYKFGRAKDSNGNKECFLQVEYTTFKGEKVETRLSSFLYFKNQDEYIDILYAPYDNRSVVYLRK